MKSILGLILELNPPHQGHKYFIEKAKELSKADYTISTLSSNFSMRGDIMVIDKFTRTKMAIELGVDLVLESPFISCVASADYFAYNSVKTLLRCNVNTIAFGVELNDINKLNAMIDIIDSEQYNNLIKQYLNSGLSYSNASLKALSSISNDEEIIKNYTLPNNTLAIQYLKAIRKLNANVNVILIKRENSNHFDLVPNNIMASSSSLRQCLFENKSISTYLPTFSFQYNVIDYNKAYKTLFDLLRYQFTLLNLNEIHSIFSIKEGIESRMYNMLFESDDYFSFVQNTKTKRYTENTIKRMILHIVHETKIDNQLISYLRVLGFNDKGKEILKALPKETKKEVITSFKKTNNTISDIIIDYELVSTKIYSILTNNNELIKEEYKIPIYHTGGNNDN